jgi:4-alpha-glucanotransferase
VLRWERHWHADGQPFRDPADYPAASVAASGTHDTEPLIVWWEDASESDRRKVNAIPTVQRVSGGEGVLGVSEARVRDVLLETLFASRSDLLLLPILDVFGWRDRINGRRPLPMRRSLPWPIDR